MKFRKWFVTILAVSALAFMLPLDADAQLKKGGNKGGGSKSGGSKSGGSKSGGSRSGGSKSGGSKSGGSKSGGSRSGGVKSGGSRSGGSQVGGSRSGGSRSGGLSKGRSGSRSGGRSTTGSRGGSRPPARTSGERTSRFSSGTRSTTSRGTLSKRVASRSGRVTYGSRSNVPTTSRTRTPSRIPEAPTVRGTSRLERTVNRANRVTAHLPYRTGYHHYSPFFVDNYFYYPHYAFHYSPGYCVPSPFYYYHHLPGYVSYARITLGHFSFSIFAHDHYTWHRPRYVSARSYTYSYPGQRTYDTGRYTDLDYAIDDIVRAFERGRMSYMEDLLPRDRFVQVAMEDYTEYRMRSDDFYDMMADLVEGTETRRYSIRDVRYERKQAVIYAEHEYRDPWGQTERKYHTIVLSETRSGFEIEYFKVDRQRTW